MIHVPSRLSMAAGRSTQEPPLSVQYSADAQPSTHHRGQIALLAAFGKRDIVGKAPVTPAIGECSSDR
jgi:hypothetical protein